HLLLLLSGEPVADVGRRTAARRGLVRGDGATRREVTRAELGLGERLLLDRERLGSGLRLCRSGRRFRLRCFLFAGATCREHDDESESAHATSLAWSRAVVLPSARKVASITPVVGRHTPRQGPKRMTDASFSWLTGGVWTGVLVFYGLRVARFGAFKSE